MIWVAVGSIYVVGIASFLLWLVTDDDRLMILTFCLVMLVLGVALGATAF